MSLLTKVKAMIFGKMSADSRPDVVQASVRIAVQRNESASERARQALEEVRFTDTIRQIARKM